MKVNNEQQNLSASNDAWEAPASSEDELSILDDLFLTAETEADIKAGCIGCGWGPPLLNHNETTAEDGADEAEFDDLPVAAEQEAQVKGGPGDGGIWLNNHNETVRDDGAADGPVHLADLPVADEQAEEIKGGPFTNVELGVTVTDTKRG